MKKRQNCRVKDGVIYAIPNPEMNSQLRQCGYRVVTDRRKQERKNACRGQIRY